MLVFIILTWHQATADLSLNEVKYLNELPLDKLIQLKSSLQEFVSDYNNVTTTPSYVNNFSAQALPLNAPPVKRTDYEGEVYKKGGKQSKLSKLFTMSVTTLAFLAFGGYLLCLIVQAKESQNPATMAPTFFVSAGIKKKPQNQIASYGRRKREMGVERSSSDLNLPPEQLFEALLKLCEGYAKWSERFSDVH